MTRRLLDPLLSPAVVESVELLAPRIRHITLAGPALSGLAWIAGQQVRLQVPASGVIDRLVGTRRTYSVWDYDGQHLELVIFDHGDGPGANWARTARPGDQLLLLKPEGNFTTTAAAYHLFVGEETASAAFGPMLRALPADAAVHAVIEVETPQEQLKLDRDVTWLYRHGASAASSASLLDAVRQLDLPDEPGICYLAGEAKTIQLIRAHLVRDRGWPRRSVLTKPFWTPGKKGLE
jgi:NADPH-dependent ferric siderophore reductase